jgi:sigma-B regulation protein RsbU (phosphoserine phosphatase)
VVAESRDVADKVRRVEAVTDSAFSLMVPDQSFRELLQRVRDLLEVDTATVLLHDAVAGQLAATAAAGIEEEVLQGVRVPVGEGFAGEVAAQRRPVVIDQVDRTTVVNPLLWEKGLHTMLGVPMLVKDELIGVLHVGSIASRRFSDGDIELLQLVADRLSLAAQAQVSGAERAAASALQRSLMPALPIEVAGLEVAGRYVPGAETGVGGDWYDVFELPDRRVGIVMGDVVGHGLPAAVVMGRLRSALRAYALDNEEPDVVLTKLDRKASHFERGAMATVAYALIEPDRQRLRLSLAGHPPPVFAMPGREGKFAEVSADPPVGFGISHSRRRSTVLDLPPGGLACFYTDGLVERRDRSIDVGLERLRDEVRAGPPDEVCAHLMSVLVGARAAEDDVALLLIRRHG